MWKFGQKLAVRKFSAKIRTAPRDCLEVYTFKDYTFKDF